MLVVVEVGNEIVVLFGGSETYVLRPHTAGTFQLLGSSYVCGYMDGETLDDDEWDESLRVIIMSALQEEVLDLCLDDIFAPVSTEAHYQRRVQSAVQY